jgi:hypothetical protein
VPGGARQVTIDSADEKGLTVRASEGCMTLRWKDVDAQSLYTVAASTLELTIPTRLLLVRFCLANGLFESAQLQLSKVRDSGEAPAELGVLEAELSSKTGEAAKKDVAGDGPRTNDPSSGRKDPPARQFANAILNIPPNETGKPISIWWPNDKRVDKELASNSALDTAAIVWFGRHPPWYGEKGPKPYDNYCEVRTMYDDVGLYIVFTVNDYSFVKGGANTGDTLYVLIGGIPNGDRPKPTDRMLVIPVGEAKKFSATGNNQSFAGNGTGWDPLPSLAVRPLPPSADPKDKPWSWRYHSGYFYSGNENPYNGYNAAIQVSWEMLGFRPSEEKEFGIAFLVADRDATMPGDLYADPGAKKEKGSSNLAAAGLADTGDQPGRGFGLADPHAKANQATEKDRGDVLAKHKPGETYLSYPFDGEHPPWRRWEPQTKTLWHFWPPRADLYRPGTWATARLRRNVIGEPQSLAGQSRTINLGAHTFIGWGSDKAHHTDPHVIVNSDLYPLHHRDFGCKGFLRFDLAGTTAPPKQALIKVDSFGGDGGDFGDTGPSLLSFFLLEGPWWAETLTQSHPFQPMPVYNGVHKLWVPRGDGHRVFDVTDVVTEAIRRKMTTLDLALCGPDTDMNSGKYFHPEGARLVITY